MPYEVADNQFRPFFANTGPSRCACLPSEHKMWGVKVPYPVNGYSKAFLDIIETRSQASGNEGEVEGLRWQLLRGSPLILSRLTLHLTSEQLAQAFNITMKMYLYEPFQNHPSNQELVGQMFRRVLFAASIDQIYGWLPKLIGLPLKAELFSGEAKPVRWPEPLGSIPWQADWRHPTDRERASWAAPVLRLIRILREGSPELSA